MVRTQARPVKGLPPKGYKKKSAPAQWTSRTLRSSLTAGGGANTGIFLLRGPNGEELVEKRRQENADKQEIMCKQLKQLQQIFKQHRHLVTIEEYEIAVINHSMVELRLFTKYYNGGDLTQHMNDVTAAEDTTTPRPTFAQMRTLMLGPWDALKFLHSKNLIHGDLKPENVFVRHNPKNYARGYIAAIADLDAIAICNSHQRQNIWGVPQTRCYSTDALWPNDCDGRLDQVGMVLVVLEFLASTAQNRTEMDWFATCAKGGFTAKHLMSTRKPKPSTVRAWQKTLKGYIQKTLREIAVRSGGHDSSPMFSKGITAPSDWDYNTVDRNMLCILSAGRKRKAC